MPPFLESLSGHFWTLAPVLAGSLHPFAPRARAWSTALVCEQQGDVRLSGQLAEPSGATTLAVLVHGLGGDAGVSYIRAAARALHARGIASLRLNLRGADGSGRGLYNAAVWRDLQAALESPELARYERLWLIGYSLGAHVVLRYVAGETPDKRVRAAAAVTPPLDLGLTAAGLDEVPGFYRQAMLVGMNASYRSYYDARSLEQRSALPAPARVSRLRSIVEWDETVTTRVWGFARAADYYGRESVAPRLGRIRIPTALITAHEDPMILRRTVVAALANVSPATKVLRVHGGHVGMPPWLSLGERAPRGLNPQLIAWLQRATA